MHYVIRENKNPVKLENEINHMMGQFVHEKQLHRKVGISFCKFTKIIFVIITPLQQALVCWADSGTVVFSLYLSLSGNLYIGRPNFLCHNFDTEPRQKSYNNY